MSKWETEPDKESFEHAGLKCVVIRHDSMKHLCGYVEIPKEHPLFEQTSIWDFPYEVHGGITFVDKLKQDPDSKYIGFDCAHLHDFIPGAGENFNGRSSVYRDFEYVKGEAKALAEQIAAAMPTATK